MAGTGNRYRKIMTLLIRAHEYADSRWQASRKMLRCMKRGTNRALPEASDAKPANHGAERWN